MKKMKHFDVLKSHLEKIYPKMVNNGKKKVKNGTFVF